MWRKVLFIVLYLCCLMSAGAENNCQKKEKSSTALEIAEKLMNKTQDIIPDCLETNKTECGLKAKMTAYLRVAKKLITQARENYPTCIDDGNKDCKYPRDCSEVLRKGLKDNGVYTIWIGNSPLKNRTIQVFCDMKTEGGGWTVIQRRGNFTPQEDFYRGWNDYREGFGDKTKDYWLGNENIFILSNQDKYEVRFDLESAEGERAFSVFERFRIMNEEAQYRLFIGRYIDGIAGDAMNVHNGQPFFTKDKDSKDLCAQTTKGGWWHYGKCGGDCNLNSLYHPGLYGYGNFIYWNQWKAMVGLAASEIKIRPIQ